MVNISEELPDPIETELLLEEINKQLAQKTFNSQDSKLLQKMVEALADKRGMIRLGFVEAFGQIGKPITPFLLDPVNNSPTAGTTLINFDTNLKGTIDPVKFIISEFKS